MSDDGSIPLQLLVIFILILLNAFFAASEIALLSVNETKMKKMAEKGNKKARHVVKFLENSSKFLSTIQVGADWDTCISHLQIFLRSKEILFLQIEPIEKL